MEVTVVGAGYVGLVSASCLAETGSNVRCVDINEQRIAELREGKCPIHEPGLEDLIQANLRAGRLSFGTSIAEAVADAEVVEVAVGTPPRTDGGANLRAVDEVAEAVAEHATGELVLVLKSTVPVGTNERVANIVAKAAHPVHVVSNPEFLKEGSAVNDFMKPDRIVIGCRNGDDYARDVLRRLYHPVTLGGDRFVWMDPASAELTKYVANTMLAMRISFMNEVARLCEKVGADVHHVRKGVGSDDRIGPKFLYAGPGYGGSCFPKDITALVHTAHEHGIELELASATERVNQRQKGVLFRRLKRHFDGSLRGRRIAVWGLAFKPNTDDIRCSPALTLLDALISEGADVVVHDPAALKNVQEIYGAQIQYAQDAYQASLGADALVLVTEWREYQNPNFRRLKQELREPVLVDGRNIWSAYGLSAMGFKYSGIGTAG